MIKEVTTDEIDLEDWKNKLATNDDDWLLRQYYGLKFVVKSMDDQIDIVFHNMKRESDDINDDKYLEDICPLENEMMDTDMQLVDVEEEMEARGLDALFVEDDE
jgi:hypothetical protein